jgi:hypothetical protein
MCRYHPPLACCCYAFLRSYLHWLIDVFRSLALVLFRRIHHMIIHSSICRILRRGNTHF